MSNLWLKLHSKKNKDNKFQDLIEVFEELKRNTECPCYSSALQILRELLNVDFNFENTGTLQDLKKNFFCLNDSKFLIFHFHQLVNIKLSKNLYSIKKFLS